jgi:hypothetical protein
MGYLVYNDATQYAFDDRTLAHLKIAITSKLRLQESFLLSWRIPAELGGGRVSVWISPAIPLQFLFQAPNPPALNRKWLEALARSSHSARGMVVLAEEDAEAIADADPSDRRSHAEIQKVLDEATSRFP